MDTNKISEEILQSLEDSWNKADGNEFGNSFTEDADFVDIRGDYHKSKIAISKGHQAIFDSIYKGSKVKYELLSSRQLNDNTIAAHAKSYLNAPSGPLDGENSSTLSMIIIKLDNDWLITSFHNTLIAAKKLKNI